MGIPPNLTAEITGAADRADRSALWRARRAFFVTPQAPPVVRSLRVSAVLQASLTFFSFGTRGASRT